MFANCKNCKCIRYICVRWPDCWSYFYSIQCIESYILRLGMRASVSLCIRYICVRWPDCWSYFYSIQCIESYILRLGMRASVSLVTHGRPKYVSRVESLIGANRAM